MAVVVLSDVFPPRHGGSGRWLWELYRRLPELNATVLAGEAPGDEAFDRVASLEIRRVARISSWGLLHVGGLRQYWRQARQVRRVLTDRSPRAIHCGKCLPEGLVALLARGRRDVSLVCFAHGEELTLAQTSWELTRLTRIVLKRASRIIANSEHTQRLLVDDWRVDRAKIAVLTPGVDTSRFVPAPPDVETRTRFGWAGRRVILTVGALQKRKGQDMLMRALPEIRRQCPDVLYAIAGEGWEREHLSQLARELKVEDVVQFMGIVEDGDLVRTYQQCDLFALPNRRVGWDIEGFGIVLLEAQACGKVAVAGASGGTVETIRPGVTGEIVDCEGPDALARTCVTLLDDPAQRQVGGAEARAWVVERFDWSVLATRAVELFLYP
jgi:phosphatidylinositol alpha-1,6-mannosyltransferase